MILGVSIHLLAPLCFQVNLDILFIFVLIFTPSAIPECPKTGVNKSDRRIINESKKHF